MTSSSHTVTLAADGDGAPLTVTATVVTVERRQEPEIFSGVRLGLYARLDITLVPDTKPDVYFLSRLIGESDWVIDAHFGPNGMPHHSNGFGARYLRVRGIAWGLADVLDQEATRLGLVQAIGRDIPLVLAEHVTDSENATAVNEPSDTGAEHAPAQSPPVSPPGQQN